LETIWIDLQRAVLSLMMVSSG